jgi:regulator of sigma E protease
MYYFYSLGFSADPSVAGFVIDTPLYTDTELEAGDVIVSIDGETFADWHDLLVYALSHTEGSTEDAPTEIVVERDGVTLDPIEFVAYGEDVLTAMGYEVFYSRIGVSPTSHFALLGSFAAAFESLGEASISIYRTIGLLIVGKVKLSQMSGFIGIYSATSAAAASGIRSLLSWVGFLSVNLGIVNLLPIPALDGGRIAFIAYEAVTGRKANQKIENILNTAMFFLLIALLVFISYHDILRLIVNG